MSRNTSKIRAEKSQAPSVQPPPPSETKNMEESVDLGCLNKSDFLSMIAQEEGQEIVSEILDELMNHVMKKCYEVYRKKQMVPFTVAWANNTILELVKWKYPTRDEGDDADTSLLLQEDTAPVPSITDSWAEGCVPVIKISNNLQKVKTDAKEADSNDPQNIQEAQSTKSESPPRKPRRTNRPMKVIPASHTKMKLEERKPHPPGTPNKLKPPDI